MALWVGGKENLVTSIRQRTGHPQKRNHMTDGRHGTHQHSHPQVLAVAATYPPTDSSWDLRPTCR